MKASEVYLKAAKAVDGNEFSCCCLTISYAATGSVFGWPNLKEAKDFQELFSPKIIKVLAWGDQWGKTLKDCQACRVLALLLMSQIVKDSE